MKESLAVCETSRTEEVSMISLDCLKQELLKRDFDVFTPEEFQRQESAPLSHPDVEPRMA
jgi:hypothetical protein